MSEDCNPTIEPSIRRFARLRLVSAWILFLCALFVFWQRHAILGLILMCFHGFVRPETSKERSAALRRPEEWIPLVLLLLSTLFFSSDRVFSSDHPLDSREAWSYLILFTLFLCWRLFLDIRLYRSLPPFRDNSRHDVIHCR